MKIRQDRWETIFTDYSFEEKTRTKMCELCETLPLNEPYVKMIDHLRNEGLLPKDYKAVCCLCGNILDPYSNVYVEIDKSFRNTVNISINGNRTLNIEHKAFSIIAKKFIDEGFKYENSLKSLKFPTIDFEIYYIWR